MSSFINTMRAHQHAVARAFVSEALGNKARDRAAIERRAREVRRAQDRDAIRELMDFCAQEGRVPVRRG